ncbi:MAG: hypothetical protein QE494_17010 [Ramlibacter sp.]|uniref:DUF6962 family protein n=1 Tax=Ramlibacter sp. TaxID=1917967 RepID=UPI002602B9D5|nr:hypothetical protein [Ramlibacter sp.]MDH4377996.1 hypothetical protein [Ramlibacter sp.]
MLSLALTDALLCGVAAWLASRPQFSIGYRMAFGLLALPALLGFLRFSGLYPMEGWHQLFSMLGACAALPLLAVCVLTPESAVARRRQFTLIFLGAAMLLGLLISGLGKLRLYDQAAGLVSMALMLWALFKAKDGRRALGPAFMVAGSLLFVTKMSVPPWLVPGDLLHLGMAAGLLLLAPAGQGAVLDAPDRRDGGSIG